MPLFWSLRPDYDQARYNSERTRLINKFVRQHQRQPNGAELQEIEAEAKRLATQQGDDDET